MNRAIPNLMANRLRDFGQDVGFRCVRYSIDGIEAQSVQMILAQPIKRILNKELAHHFASRTIEINRLAPWRVMMIREELRSVEPQVIPFWSEVVVDNIKKYHHASMMGNLNEMFQIMRSAILAIGRKRKDAVISPVPPPGKIRDRHQLNRRDTKFGQVFQAAFNSSKGAFPGEGADMQFVDHRLFPRSSHPARIGPVESLRIDDFAGAMNIGGLKAGGGIGNFLIAVDLILVAGARSSQVSSQFEPTFTGRVHGESGFAVGV